MGATTSRAAARQRLAAGFLTTLPSQLAELAEIARDQSPEGLESAAHELMRMGDTAASLGLTPLADAARTAADELRDRPAADVFADLVRAFRHTVPLGPFAPIAILGDLKQIQSIAQQDDQTCERLHLFDELADLERRCAADWPQAVVLPAALHESTTTLRTRFGCPVYLYGPARADQARLAASRAGATAYLAEPVVLPELLSAVRRFGFRASRKDKVALVGDPKWSGPIAASLRAAGLYVHESTDAHGVGAVLHGLYPEAVLFGPSDPGRAAEGIQMARGHVGRSHVALLVVGEPERFVGTGVDAVVGAGADVVSIIQDRLERFRDHPRDVDPLTQVPDRCGLLSALQRELARAERSGEVLTIGLVRAKGLDEARQVHGPEASNAFRRHLAISLERGLRRSDHVGVLAPDLFCVLMVGARAVDATPRLRSLCAAFQDRAHGDRRLRGVSLLVGVVDTSIGTRDLLPRAMDRLGSSPKIGT